MSRNQRRVLLPPINFVFKLLQQQSRVNIWLYDQLGIRIEGRLRGFDEFLNVVLDDAVEVKQATKANPNPQAAEDGGRRAVGKHMKRLVGAQTDTSRTYSTQRR